MDLYYSISRAFVKGFCRFARMDPEDCCGNFSGSHAMVQILYFHLTPLPPLNRGINYNLAT
jgi:hypothetical protein